MLDGQPSQAYTIFSPRTLVIVRPCAGSQESIWAEVAATQEEREEGLSKAKELAPLEGMLFLFPFSGRPVFTLAKTSVSLDVIFLRSIYRGSESEMSAIVMQVAPTRAMTSAPVIPRDVVDLVLEVNYGVAEMLGINEGAELLIRAAF